MPKAQIPVGYAKAEQVGKLDGSTWANVLYYAVDTSGSPTPGDVVESVAKATQNFLANSVMLPYFPSAWTTSYVNVLYRDATDSLVRVRVADVTPGTGSGGYQDAQVCYLINWSTGDPRKGGKPRQYVAGVLDSSMADSAELIAGVQNDWNTRLIAWLAAIPTPSSGQPVGLQLVEMSFRDGNAWRTTPHSYPILGGSLNPVVATQRRRVDRRRPH